MTFDQWIETDEGRACRSVTVDETVIVDCFRLRLLRAFNAGVTFQAESDAVPREIRAYFVKEKESEEKP